jgi:hypothetical protein
VAVIEICVGSSRNICLDEYVGTVIAFVGVRLGDGGFIPFVRGDCFVFFASGVVLVSESITLITFFQLPFLLMYYLNENHQFCPLWVNQVNVVVMLGPVLQ